MRPYLVLFLLSLLFLTGVRAQSILPEFSATLKSNGKVLISWRNTYPRINQLSIQRSTDSLRNFTTLVSVPDPKISENGFVDSKATGTKMYYRIFILFPNSKYLFTKSQRARAEINEVTLASENKPAIASVNKSNPQAVIQNTTNGNPAISPIVEEQYLILPKIDNSRIYYMMEKPNLKKPTINNTGRIKSTSIEVQKTLYVKRRDSIIMTIAGKQVPRFSDSLLKQTKDTLFFVDADTIQIKPYVEVYKEPKEIYKVSQFVYISKDGNVTISLADYNRKKYHVQFFETDNTPVMEINNITDPVLIIDKANFEHAGWFRFELYEDGKLKEKNKLLIPKEF